MFFLLDEHPQQIDALISFHMLINLFLKVLSGDLSTLLFVKLLEVRFDERKRVGLLADAADIRITGGGLTVQNVVFYRLVEENGLLHDVANLAAEGLDVVFLNLVTVDEDLATLDVVESQQEVCDR